MSELGRDAPGLSLPCNALLIDLDGTLVDSAAAVEQGWAGWAETVGVDAQAVLAVAHGQPSRATVEQFAPGTDVAEAIREIEDMQAAAAVVHALPGALALVRSLQPDEWAVVTSGTRRTAEHRLRQAGLPRPGHLVTADDYRRGKPHPDPYLLGARLLGVEPSQCVAVEDTVPGAVAAQRADAQVVGLATPRTAYPAGVVTIDSLNELTVDRSRGMSRLVTRVQGERA